MHVKFLILGGGLTGLSTAFHLEERGCTDYLVLERENAPGGLCASQTVQGFTFDKSGHLLHLHTCEGKKLVNRLLKTNLRRCKRRAFICTKNTQVPFPFQANLYALPKAERQKCVDGLVKAAQKTYKTAPRTFQAWCLRAFGAGIYKQFMRPYNTKLWGRSPSQLTAEWCGPFVPKPSVREVLQSAAQPTQKSYGYNSFFYYPKTGGCGALVAALAAGVSRLKVNTPVTQIDLATKTVHTPGETFTYDTLVSTLPLPELLRLTRRPKALAWAQQLAHTSVSVFNFAIARRVKPFSWIYFQEENVPFYRVGLQSGFSPANAPQNASSFYVELPGTLPRTPATEARIWKALSQKGIIKSSDAVLFSFWQFLPYAYAVYDASRTPVVRRALAALARRGCLCAGRYGRWEYSFMERSLLEGLELAKKLV